MIKGQKVTRPAYKKMWQKLEEEVTRWSELTTEAYAGREQMIKARNDLSLAYDKTRADLATALQDTHRIALRYFIALVVAGVEAIVLLAIAAGRL